ncbi:sporulation protein YjcZ [Clostridium kluyveri]|nr:sporulation protein YjcZ [Clostridium kluyveri]UZQ50146.1 hypothetical protein OP486_19740 [Clostridium kluyveri]
MSRCGRRYDSGCGGFGRGKEVLVIIILLLLCGGLNCGSIC